MIVMFSPNGTIPKDYWPDETGRDFKLKEILSPLEAFKDRMLVLHGLSNKVRGDGDGHMRGMSCLLTGIELFPGNIQGGSDTPAGWASAWATASATSCGGTPSTAFLAMSKTSASISIARKAAAVSVLK